MWNAEWKGTKCGAMNVLLNRTRKFALDVIRLTEALPRSRSADVIARQLVRSGTSVGANYRAACRARSRAEFVAKLGIVEEEADESAFWIDLLVGSGFVSEHAVAHLSAEADELVALTVASIRTARANRG